MKSGLKMSKSLRNFITVPSFLEKYSADHFRMMCLITHYRTSKPLCTIFYKGSLNIGLLYCFLGRVLEMLNINQQPFN